MKTEHVGLPLDRVDGRAKVTGAAQYSAEFELPNMAYAVIVTSNVTRGRLRKIYTTAARKAPGVLFVYTHENFRRLKTPKAGGSGGGKPGEKALPLQNDKVEYDGQIIGMVVADTLERAVQAAGLVEADYARETPVIKMQQALGTAYEAPASAGKKLKAQRGSVDGALGGAAQVHKATYTTPIENHNPIEPPASIAAWKGDKLTLYTSTQGVVGSRALVAEILGVETGQIEVKCPFLGGGFGCKGFVWAHPILAAVAAQDLRRPIKLVQSREQMFSLNGHRAATIQEITLAADSGGKLLATRHLTTSHTSFLDNFVEAAGVQTPMLYACPNLDVNHHLIKVNVGTPTPMRAPGESPGTFALESAMDELAYKLNIDPLELRLRNYAEVDPDSGLPWSSKHLRECYQKGAAAFGWSNRKGQVRATRSGNWLIGQGMATATYPANRQKASAQVRLSLDGVFTVGTASQDIGTGTYTIMTQVAADALGVAPIHIRCLLGDTSLPPAPGSGGSQTAASVGPAVREACLGLRCKLIDAASKDSRSPLFGATAEQVDGRDGQLFLLSDPSKVESYLAILRRSGSKEMEAKATTATAKDEKEGTHASGGCPAMRDGWDATSDKDQFSFHSFGAMFCEVAVDADLGFVRVRRFVTALDIGRVLNHKTARSQAMGGVIYGIGMGLLEKTTLDPVEGRLVTRNLADYLVPVNADVPQIDVHFIEHPDERFNVLGSRGVGEIGITGVAAALANAVYHATGKRVRDLPITADKLL